MRRQDPRTFNTLRTYARSVARGAIEPLHVKPLAYHPTQYRVWTEASTPDGLRFIAIAAGRRSGKTDLAVMRVWRAASRAYPWQANFGIGAPTRKQVKDIYWERLKNAIPRRYWAARANESDLTVRLVNGNSISLAGMEAAKRVEGRPWDGWVLDEYADMDPNVWPLHIRPTLVDRKGWAWKIGVPEGRNHFHETCMKYRLDGAEPGATVGYYHWSARSVLPLYLGEDRAAEEIASLRRELDDRIFRQEIDADFVTLSGRIYYNFDPDLDVHDFPLLDSIGSEAMPWIGGMDFNVSPMCAMWGWEWQVGSDTHVFVWDEIAEDNADTVKAGRLIQSKCAASKQFGQFLIHPDPSGRARHTSSPAGTTDLSILARLGFHVRTRSAAPMRRDRYNAVNAMLCSGDGRRRIHIHPRCRNLIRSLDGLLYAEGTSDPDLVKSKNLDHAPDGLGYWIEKRFPLRTRAVGFSV